MTFEPEKYFINLGKDRNNPRTYLPVPARIAWFRDEFGTKGGISTDLISLDPRPLVKATVYIDGVVIASAMASVPPTKGSETWSGREVEKAETAAIGRALAHAGYGTLQAMMEEDDIDNLADSPVESKSDRLVREMENERRDELKPENVAGKKSSPFGGSKPQTSGGSGDNMFVATAVMTKTVENGKNKGNPYYVFLGEDISASAWSMTDVGGDKLFDDDERAMFKEPGKHSLPIPVNVFYIEEVKGEKTYRNASRIEAASEEGIPF